MGEKNFQFSMSILILFVAWSVSLPRVRGLLLRLGVREEERKRRGVNWQITRWQIVATSLTKQMVSAGSAMLT